MADPTREEAEFEDDDEGGGESTVAMQSPSFDPSMPSPVSVAPPPPGGGPLATTPLPFAPPAASPRFAAPTAQSPAVPPGASPRSKRAQTVIGIAPPGQGAQRPPTPINPAAPVAAPPPPQRPASVPRVPARPPALDDGEPSDGFGAFDEAIEKEPPTRAIKVDAATFALDEAAGAAARAATRPSPVARHSPLASTGFAPNGPGPLGAMKPPAAAPKPLPRPPTMDQENTTTAFVDDLNLVLAAKGSGGLPKLHENEGDDESTRAVPREELLRQDAQLVVGSDAAGEDATLAVPPGMNEALSARFPIGADGSGGHPAVSAPSPGFLGSANPTQQSPQFPMLGPQTGAWGMPGAQTSQMPSSTSAMPMLPPYQQPGAFPPVQGGPMPMPYPPQQDWQQQQPSPQGWQQQGWQQPMHGAQMAPASPKKFPLSTQVIVLGLIGIVCLAIFVTGVVLFFTTKF